MPAITSMESLLLNLINADRQKAGAAPLVSDGELMSAARDHSAWQGDSNVLSHTGAGGSNPGARIEKAGYGASGWAENVAYVGDKGAAGVVDAAEVQQLHTNLMNSPGHRANLLNKSMQEVGLGFDVSGGKVYVTEVFGKPNAKEAGEPDDSGSSPAPAPAPLPPVKPVPPATEIKGAVKVGTAGSDWIKGTAGADTITGGKGNDLLIGGKGADTFVFKSARDGVDKILDFQRGADKIDLSKIRADFDIEQTVTKAGLLIEVDIGGHDYALVQLSGVHQALSDAHFIQ